MVFQPGDQHLVARCSVLRPQLYATRLMAAVVPLVQMSCSGFGLARKSGHGVPGLLEGVGRTVAQVWTPRCTLALSWR